MRVVKTNTARFWGPKQRDNIHSEKLNTRKASYLNRDVGVEVTLIGDAAAQAVYICTRDLPTRLRSPFSANILIARWCA